MSGVKRFMAPGPWITRDLKECVRASDYDALAAENAALRSTIDDLTANEIHTCHDHCQRTACILRRENTALRSRLADIEAQNRVMWDVANDREARLAEAEALEKDAMEAFVLIESAPARGFDVYYAVGMARGFIRRHSLLNASFSKGFSKGFSKDAPADSAAMEGGE